MHYHNIDLKSFFCVFFFCFWEKLFSTNNSTETWNTDTCIAYSDTLNFITTHLTPRFPVYTGEWMDIGRELSFTSQCTKVIKVTEFVLCNNPGQAYVHREVNLMIICRLKRWDHERWSLPCCLSNLWNLELYNFCYMSI